MMVWVLSCHDDECGTPVGVYTSEARGLGALRHAVGKDRFSAMTRKTSEYNPAHHTFIDDGEHADDDGTCYMLVGYELDHHA